MGDPLPLGVSTVGQASGAQADLHPSLRSRPVPILEGLPHVCSSVVIFVPHANLLSIFNFIYQSPKRDGEILEKDTIFKLLTES